MAWCVATICILAPLSRMKIHLQQITFETNVTIREIDHDEQFLFLHQCLQLDAILLFIKFFHTFALVFSMLSASDCLYVGKG